jgi:hypothetical protein
MNIEKTREKLASVTGTPVADLPTDAGELATACTNAGIEAVNDESDENSGGEDAGDDSGTSSSD